MRYCMEFDVLYGTTSPFLVILIVWKDYLAGHKNFFGKTPPGFGPDIRTKLSRLLAITSLVRYSFWEKVFRKMSFGKMIFGKSSFRENDKKNCLSLNKNSKFKQLSRLNFCGKNKLKNLNLKIIFWLKKGSNTQD